MMQLGLGRAQVSEEMKAELLCKFPQSWDKSIFYQTQEVKRSLSDKGT